MSTGLHGPPVCAIPVSRQNSNQTWSRAMLGRDQTPHRLIPPWPTQSPPRGCPNACRLAARRCLVSGRGAGRYSIGKRAVRCRRPATIEASSPLEVAAGDEQDQPDNDEREPRCFPNSSLRLEWPPQTAPGGVQLYSQVGAEGRISFVTGNVCALIFIENILCDHIER